MREKGAVILPSFSDAFRAFKSARNKADMLVYIEEYWTSGTEPDLPEKGEKTVAWRLIRPLLDSMIKDYENGKKGGAPKGNKNAKKTTGVELEINPITTPLVLENNPRCSESAAKKTTEKEKEKEKELKNIPPKSPKGYSEEFEKFWAVYPRHDAKQDAFKAFSKAIKDIDLISLMNAAIAFSKTEAWQRDDGKYIPYAASWLNGRRWEDLSAAKEQPKKKDIPHVSECPICHSFEITQSMDRFKCNACNLVWDWNHETEKWEITL